METITVRRRRGKERSSFSTAFVGVLLIALGTLLFLDKMDVLEFGRLWRFWPVVLIGLGMSHILESSRENLKSIGTGVMLVLVGVVFILTNFHMLGLTFRTSWPLLLLAVGIGIVVMALLEHREIWGEGAEREENLREGQGSICGAEGSERGKEGQP